MTEIEMRELDAWIAEHVMGFKLNANGMIETWPRKGVRHDLSVKSYSTDPAAAMEVYKKLCWAQECPLYYNAKEKWQLRTMKLGEEITVEGDTAEIAICLFAKKLFSK